MNDTEYFTPYTVDLYSLTSPSLEKYISKTLELPNSMGHILTDHSTSEFIEAKLGHELGLNTKQQKEIARIIRDILLCDLYLGNFVATISNNLQVDQQTTNSIANLIISDLFGTVLEDIKKLQIQKFGNEESSPPLPKSTDFGTPSPSFSRNQSHYQGEELPETGGNIIDLRKVNQ